MGLLGIQLELVAEAMHGLGLVSCDSETKIRQHDLWMIPIIIHNFFPSAAELLAGLVLFACRFDACYITQSSVSFTHQFSHYLSSFFPFTLFFPILYFSHVPLSGSVSVSLTFCFSLLQWSVDNRVKSSRWNVIHCVIEVLALWQFTVLQKLQLKNKSPVLFFNHHTHNLTVKANPPAQDVVMWIFLFVVMWK